MPSSPRNLPHYLREALALLNLWGKMGYYQAQVTPLVDAAGAFRLELCEQSDKDGKTRVFGVAFPLPKGEKLTTLEARQRWHEACATIVHATPTDAEWIWDHSLIRRAAPQIEANMVARGLFPPYLHNIAVVGGQQVVLPPKHGWKVD